MLWVTRHTIRVNRAATAWLVRRFVDPSASFCFVEPADVARVQQDQGAIGFDAPGARYPHRDLRGRCSFEALVDEYAPLDHALRELGRIVHLADFPEETAGLGRAPSPEAGGSFDRISLTPETGCSSSAQPLAAIGLRAISQDFLS
jgi:hypothetical protein